MGMNLENKIQDKIWNAQRKWKIRINENPAEGVKNEEEIIPKNDLRPIPNSLIQVVNMLNKT